jgi:hypothetical protein
MPRGKDLKKRKRRTKTDEEKERTRLEKEAKVAEEKKQKAQKQYGSVASFFFTGTEADIPDANVGNAAEERASDDEEIEVAVRRLGMLLNREMLDLTRNRMQIEMQRVDCLEL